AAIMIHGRSMKQRFSGEIDYLQIKKVKSITNIPIIANGGINTPEDAMKMIKKTDADGVGVARGALIKPWLFSQTKEFLEKGEYEEFGIDKIKKAAVRHAKMSSKRKGKHGIIEMRKYLLWYFRGFEGAREVRKELVKVESVKDIEKVLRNIN
ncbi:MAG: tRNA-dihydrouridine synthase, partial [Candidatus Andersenbacteria bacterium]|nr:tRNA-dihydrouridine synthase [Candidatus Andersenbacteria bacterium]